LSAEARSAKVEPAPRTIAPSAPPDRTEKVQNRTDTPKAPDRTDNFKDRFLAEIRSGKGFFYNTVVAQAQRIDVAGDKVTFTFLPTHKALKEQFEQSRQWLESTAERVAGRKIAVTAVQSAPAPGSEQPVTAAPPKADATSRDLKAEAQASPAVQAVLDVFGQAAEIRDVEEIEP
jgi:hypothetical protein